MMKRRFRKKNYASQPDKRSVNPLKHIYDSSGGPTRMRGNAQQLHEKYTALAREALSNGDKVAMEHYYQYAEHYQRQINQFQENMDSRNRDFPPPSSPPSPSGDFGEPRPRKTNGRRPPSSRPSPPSPSPYDDFDDFAAPQNSQAKTDPDNENGDSLPIPGAISSPDEPPRKATAPSRKTAKAKGRPRKLPPKPGDDGGAGGDDDDDIF